MKRLKLLILLVGLLALNSLGARAGQITHTVTYDASKLAVTYDTINGNVYARVEYDGLSSCNEASYPELPSDVIMLSVPYNATNFTVQYKEKSFYETSISSIVYPAQEPRAISDTTDFEFTQPNSIIYSSSSFYPTSQNENVEYGYLCGSNKIVSIELRPILYNPSNGKLRLLTEVDVKVNYSINSHIVPYVYRNEYTIKQLEQDVTASCVRNGADVTNNSFVNTIHPTLNQWANNETLPTYNYCIITNRELEPAFKKIIAMKRQKGISAGTLCIEDLMTSSICNGGDVNLDEVGDTISVIADSAGVVRQYLKYAYTNNVTPTKFLLMGGKAPFAPVRYANTRLVQNSRSKNHASCDMYFSDLSLNWVHFPGIFDDTNEVEYIIPGILEGGNTIPYYPDIYIGRILCSSKEEINNYSDKLYRYVFLPSNKDKSYLTKSLFFSSGTVNASNVLVAASDAFDSVTHIINNKTDYLWSGAQLINHLNECRYGYLSLYAHGEPQSIAIYDIGNTKKIVSALDSNPSTDSIYNVIEENSNGLDNLNNKDFPLICYSISCVTAPYDKAKTYYSFTTIEDKYNLSESFTLGKDYGGAAYLGNSRNGYPYESGWLEKQFVYSSFNDHCYSIGMAEAFSKVNNRITNSKYYNHVLLEHNLLGDPEFEIWTSEPLRYSNISVCRYQHSFFIQGININDTVSYCDNDGNVGRTNGNTNGYVVLANISPNSSVMIYNHEHIPYMVPLMLQNCNINNSQYVYASSFSAGNSIVPNITHGNVTIKNGAVYEIEASDDVFLGEGLIVENGASFNLKTPGKVTIDGCVFQSGAKVKIEAGNVEFVGKFTAELGSKVEFTKYVDY